MACGIICVFFVKCIVIIYTILTFPIYFICQRPWKRWKMDNFIWAAFSNPDNPYSPIIRSENGFTHAIEEVQTVEELFRISVSRNSIKKCLGFRNLTGESLEYQKDGKQYRRLCLGDYQWFSYNEVDERIDALANGFLSIGFRPRKLILILAETRIEWFLTLHACFRINVPVTTLYATLGKEGWIHGINETEITTIIISQEILTKLEQVLDRLPNIQQIIIMEDIKPLDLKNIPQKIACFKFSVVETMGTLSEDVAKPEPPSGNDIAVIMYTSGSTGVPKGVVITHRNMVSTMFSVKDAFSDIIRIVGGRYIAFLPLAHIFEMIVENFVIFAGGSIGYSSPNTFTDKSTAIMPGCKGDATLLQPEVIAGVPLLLDRISKSINEAVSEKGEFSRELFAFSIKYKQYWDKKGYNTPIVNRLIFRKIKKLVGGKVNLIVSAGAPLSPNTALFIKTCLCVRLVQAYGLTETAATGAIMSIDDHSVGTVGPPSSGAQIKLVDWAEGGYKVTDEPNPRGEIVIGGEAVVSGYFKNKTLTDEVFKKEETKWFHTGDIGEFCSNGSIKIIDRKKDLVKLQGGEYVSLGKIESELKTSPLVDNICALASPYCNYLIAIVVPNVKHLQTISQKDMPHKGLSFYEQCESPQIVAVFKQKLTEYAKKCNLTKQETPQKYYLCTEEWLPESGLVTAALKIRRKYIEQHYHSVVADLFEIIEPEDIKTDEGKETVTKKKKKKYSKKVVDDSSNDSASTSSKT